MSLAETLGRLLRSAKSKSIVFGARGGRLFGDCPADLFIAMNRHGWRCVWVTRSPEIREKICKQGFRCELIGSRRHKSLLRNARAVVMSSTLLDIADSSSDVPDGTLVVFTGHGKSSKASGLSSRYHLGASSSLPNIGFVSRRAAIALAPSAYRAPMIAECYGLPNEKVIVTGLPRTDKLFDPTLRREALPKTQIPGQTSKFLYAPTWRKHNQMQPTRLLGYSDFDLPALIDHLNDMDAILYVRPHIQDELRNMEFMNSLDEIKNKSPRIVPLLSTEVSDVNSVLHEFNALITDYSSIEDDFLLLERPIIYAPYDYDSFEKKQGFIENYFETRGGTVANSMRELMEAMDKVVCGEDIEAQRRKDRLRTVHDFTDGAAIGRAITVIETALREAGVER